MDIVMMVDMDTVMGEDMVTVMEGMVVAEVKLCRWHSSILVLNMEDINFY